MHSLIRRRLSVSIFIVSFVCSASSSISAQQGNERVLKKQTIKKVGKSIQNLARKGYVPVDATVESNGRRAMFSVRLVKPKQPIEWFGKFDLTESDFESINGEYARKQLRIVWHDTYTTKGKVHHACIWHFDPGYKPLSKEDAVPGKPKPAPNRVDIIWNSDTRIPVASKGHAAFADLEKQTLDFMRANQMPALSTAVSCNGEVLYEGSFGYSNLDTKLNIKEEMPIRICSISKLLTVVAALQLIDRGKLKLNQPVYPLLGIEPWKKVSVDSRSNDITVLHLLQETAGYDSDAMIEPGLKPRTLAERMKLKEPATPTQAIQYILSQPLSYTPGEKRANSSYGYFLLGRVIEKVSGQSYEEYVLNNIAKPLNLQSLTMSRSDPDKRTNREVKNVLRSGGWFSKLNGKNKGSWVHLNDGGYHFGLLDASQGWMASAGDLLRLTSAIQATPSPILSPQAKVLLIAKPEYVLNKEAETGKPEVSWKGCSVFCNNTSKGVTFFLHTNITSGSAGLVCHSSSSVSFCYIFSCATTIADVNPRDGYDPILRKEAYRVRNLLLGK